jgi:hypothetical protein
MSRGRGRLLARALLSREHRKSGDTAPEALGQLGELL